jgi:hypothetical protein
MKYAVEIGSGDMIYIPSFIEIDSGVQTLLEEDTHSKRSCKPTCISSK